MSAAKHTPGPWLVANDAQGVCGLMHPTQHGVAIAWFSSAFVPASGYVDEAKQPLGRPERAANARLIAAAPDLLAALQGLGLACQFDVLNPCWNNRASDVVGKHWGVGTACSDCVARAAIAKATQS